MTTNQTIDGVPRGRSVSVSFTLTKQQERDIRRFYDTCEDGQGYDVPKDRMKSLARLGLIRPTGFSRYEITDLGDAVIEELRALLDTPAERPEPHAWVVISPDGKELSELQASICAAKDLAYDMDCELPASHAGGKHEIREVYFSAPAAQPQGEAVAYADPKAFENFGSLAHLGGLYAKEWMWANPAPGLMPLYAHPPEPVAVVLPERKTVSPHNSHDWDEGHADGWKAYDEELKRLKPSL